MSSNPHPSLPRLRGREGWGVRRLSYPAARCDVPGRRPAYETLTGEYGCRRASLAMGKYVFGRPTRQIEADPIGQEPKTCRREVLPPFSCQKCIKLVLQRVQVQHIGCRIGDLSVREISAAPVGQLLLLGNLDAEEIADEILEPMLVGVCARKPRGDLRAINRARHHPEAHLQGA